MRPVLYVYDEGSDTHNAELDVSHLSLTMPGAGHRRAASVFQVSSSSASVAGIPTNKRSQSVLGGVAAEVAALALKKRLPSLREGHKNDEAAVAAQTGASSADVAATTGSGSAAIQPNSPQRRSLPRLSTTAAAAAAAIHASADAAAVCVKTSEESSAEAAVLVHVRSLFSLEATRPNFLSFKRGEVMEVLIRKPGSKWWYGKHPSGNKGWIPSNYVEDVAADADAADTVPDASVSEAGADATTPLGPASGA